MNYGKEVREQMEEKHYGPVWFIPGEKDGRYPFCHSIYIEGAGVLIDPGSDRGRLAQIRETPGVKTVWLSHWHEDHIKHLDLFDDLPLWISEADARPISDVELFMDAYGMDNADERRFWRSELVEEFNFRPRKPEGFLRGESIIKLDTVTVEILGTPGHTPGHLAFLLKEPGVLFMGDYDLSDFGPWYGDVEADIEDTIASVRRLREVPAKVWVAGHENRLFERDPGERWDHYLDIIAQREEKLMNLLENPQSLEDIVGAWIVYGKPKEPKAFFEFGERALMKKHLERLMKAGLVAMDGRAYFRT
jgi:glyoxylase-like metal-dependent hydrolase (beta-lactamase superfamily II)